MQNDGIGENKICHRKKKCQNESGRYLGYMKIKRSQINTGGNEFEIYVNTELNMHNFKDCA